MKIGIIILFVIVLVAYVIYRFYFEDYTKVRKMFRLLQKFLDARDSLVLKLVPDIKDKKLSKEVLKRIEERKLNFSSGQNNAILSDIKLNAILKKLYEQLNLVEKNDLEKEIFISIMQAEQKLRHLRQEYNHVVFDYNQNLLRHNIVCLKLIKMKPLDQYKSDGGGDGRGRVSSVEPPLGAQGFQDRKIDEKGQSTANVLYKKNSNK